MPLKPSARKTQKAMQKRYGPKKGKSIFFAWANKHNKKIDK